VLEYPAVPGESPDADEGDRGATTPPPTPAGMQETIDGIVYISVRSRAVADTQSQRTVSIKRQREL